MPRNTSVSLGEPLTEYINQQVESGAYGSASEVIRDALRMMMRQNEKIEAVRAALIEGENSGEPTDFDFDAFLERKNSEKAA